MVLIDLVLAAAIPASFALAISLWCWRANDRFFRLALAAYGRPDREPTPFPWSVLPGDGVGIWDWLPASRALATPSEDATLEAARQRASRANRIEGLLLITALPVIALATISALPAYSYATIIAAGIGGVFSWSLSRWPGYRYSVPHMQELDGAMWAYYLIPVAIVAGTLLLAGVLIAVARAFGR